MLSTACNSVQSPLHGTFVRFVTSGLLAWYASEKGAISLLATIRSSSTASKTS